MLVASLGVILAGFDWLDGFPTSAAGWIQRAVCAALGVVGVVLQTVEKEVTLLTTPRKWGGDAVR